MEVYRISKCRFIRDLSGFGAYTYGGRWNSKGHAVIYTAGSQALALLEVLAHIERPPVGNFCRISLSIPDDSILAYSPGLLPEGWQAHPSPDALKSIGDAFIRERAALVLKLPSVIVPDEANFLINPAHPRFSEVRIVEEAGQAIDERLL